MSDGYNFKMTGYFNAGTPTMAIVDLEGCRCAACRAFMKEVLAEAVKRSPRKRKAVPRMYRDPAKPEPKS